MYWLIATYLFILGAALGSFAGAMAWRLYNKRNVVRERSECESCHHTLGWHDLVPLISWLSLRGKCRYCNSLIGKSPFLIESGLGLAFFSSYLFWPYGLDSTGIALLVAWLIALVLLTILFVYDSRHFLLPDVLVWPLVVVGVGIFCLRSMLQGVPIDMWPLEAGLSLIPISGLYGALYVISRGTWIGFGDVKLGLFIGLALGWQGALAALLVANYLGFFWVLPGLLNAKRTKSAHIPFGPFLIVATFVVFLWGERLINWFMDILVP